MSAGGVLSRVSGRGRVAAPIRLVHLGLGNFFRAHQAWYTDRAPDAEDWGIAAFTGRSARLSDALDAQQGLYTLVTRAGDGDRFDVMSSLSRAYPAADHDAWLRLRRFPGGARDHGHGHRGGLPPGQRWWPRPRARRGPGRRGGAESRPGRAGAHRPGPAGRGLRRPAPRGLRADRARPLRQPAGQRRGRGPRRRRPGGARRPGARRLDGRVRRDRHDDGRPHHARDHG